MSISADTGKFMASISLWSMKHRTQFWVRFSVSCCMCDADHHTPVGLFQEYLITNVTEMPKDSNTIHEAQPVTIEGRWCTFSSVNFDLHSFKLLYTSSSFFCGVLYCLLNQPKERDLFDPPRIHNSNQPTRTFHCQNKDIICCRSKAKIHFWSLAILLHQ